MKKACIFVDGENFRHSLKALFQDGNHSFKRGQYLPVTDWHHFFEGIANNLDCELLRTYWYVVQHIDCRPYKIPHDWNAKERFLRRWYAEALDKCTTETERRDKMLKFQKGIEVARTNMETRAKGFNNIHEGIENKNDQIEFRKSGSIPYDLMTREFGTEKGVDTQLATDVIELAPIYEVAIILSGDADYLPPVAAVKRRGRLVYSVSFLNQRGRPLPGGARRLSNAVDRRLELPFEAVRNALGIEVRDIDGAGDGARSRSSVRPQPVGPRLRLATDYEEAND